MDLLTACEYSKQAYLNENIDEYSRLISHKETDAEMHLIILNDKEIVLAFRGTESIRDWIMNVKSRKVSLFDMNIMNDMNEKNKLKLTDIKVHKGFYKQYQGLYPDIIDYFEINKDKLKKFYCIGHSLGGALANIASVDLKMRFKDLECECYTFGAPRTGNKLFSKVFEKLVSKSTRAVYDDDIVPRIPGYWRGYRHCGTKLKFKDKKIGFFKKILNWIKFDFIEDHNIDNYIFAINNI